MPTSVVIAAAASSAGAAIAGSAWAYSAIASTSWLTYSMIAASSTVVAGMALNSLAYGVQNQGSSDFAAQSAGRDQVVRSGVANRTVVYGRAMVSGPLVFAAVSGSGNAKLHMVIPLAGHEIDAVEAIYFNDVLLGSRDGAGNVTDGDYAGVAAVRVHPGTPGDTADAALVAANVGWTAAHKLAGVAYLVVELSWSQDKFPTGIPNIKAIVRGKKVYDPRSATTAWSANFALCVRDYLTNSYGLECGADELHAASFITAANIADEAIGLAGGGTEARYSCNGVLDLGQTPRSIMGGLLSSGSGFLVWTGGKYVLHAGAYTAPAVTLTADDLRDSIKVRPRIARRDLFNAVRGTYVDPVKYWQPGDFPPVSNATYAAQDGGQVIWRDVALPFTTSGATAQRIAKLMLDRSRQGITVEFPAKLTAFKVATLDTVMLTISQLGWSAKEFKVLEWKFSADGGVDLVLQEETASSYAWNSGMETVIDPAPDTNLPDPFTVESPASLTLTSGASELLQQGDGTVVSRIKAVWPSPVAAFITSAEIQYKLAADAAWQSAGFVPAALGVAYIAPAQDGAVYDTRIRFENSIGVRGGWTSGAPHTVIGKTEPPSTVGAVSYTLEPFGIPISWPGVPDLDLAGYEIRVGGSGWDDAAFLASVTAAEYLWQPQAAGSYTVRVKARDTSGNYSAAASSAVVEVTAPAAPAGTHQFAGTDEVLGWSIPASGGFLVDRYEIRTGASWATGTFVDSTKVTSYRRRVDYLGQRTYWVAAIDAAGNVGAAGSVVSTVAAPGAVSALRAEVIDNNVLLPWEPPASGSLPVERYEARKGASWDAGSVIGSNGNSTFAAVFEQVAGTYTYWVAAVDSAGNVGAATSATVYISQPPDYVLRASIDSTFSGTKVNTLLDGGTLLLPVNTAETWEQHFSNHGWATPQDQINAGFPLYIEPGLASSSYSEDIDYGSVLPTTNIQVTLEGAPLAGTVGMSCQISTKLNAGDAWTNAPAGATSALAISFRYVRVVWSFSATAGANLLRVTGMNAKISVKQRGDSGSGSSAVGGTFIPFNYAFLSADTPSVQPAGSTPLIPVVIYSGGPNPTGFTVKLYNTSGVEVGGDFSWSVRGY